MIQRLFLFIPLLIFNLIAFSQVGQYDFSRIDSRNGLSHNQINAIFKDDLGFMWFGTMSGLNRYDGYKFKIFKHNQSDTTSISDDYISSIVGGPDNKMWVLTRNGWSVYDPLTEKFNNRPSSFLHSIQIPDNNFTDIVRDKKNNFWFVFPGRGLYLYDIFKKQTRHFGAEIQASFLHSNAVSAITADLNGDIWIVYSDGSMDKMDGNSYKIIQHTNTLQKSLTKSDFDFKLFVDRQNELWIFGLKSSLGVFHYKPLANQVVSFNKDTKTHQLNSNLINGITQDEKGNIWIATDHGGVNLINKNNLSVRYLLNTEGEDRSISQNSINCIYKDNSGIIWVGTFRMGVNHYHENILKFRTYKHNHNDPNSISFEDINALAEDAAGNIWIGSNGGGLIYFNRSTGKFKQFLHNSDDPNSVSNNVIVSLFIDHEQKLWIGSYFGGLDRYDGKRFVHHRHDDADPSSLADDRVWNIFEDSKHRLWIGTLEQGVDLYNREENRFIHYKQGAPNSVHSRYVSSIIEDRNQNIWFATAFGLDVLDARTGVFNHFEHNPNDNRSLSQNNLIDLIEDSRGLIWIGSRDGLNVYDPVKKQFQVFTTKDGLPDNTIVALLEDNNQNVWVTTPGGLSKLTVSFAEENRQLSIKCVNYDESDGLQGRQFNERASLKTRNGELAFAGPNGFNIFQPADIKENRKSENVLVTDLKIFNNSVLIGRRYDRDIILNQSITRSQEVTLNYDQNVFTLEFASLTFLNPQRIKYAYQLEGFNNEWLETDGKNNSATFTNLDPGKYHFKVKTIRSGEKEDGPVYTLQINILPPFWKTPAAYFVYFMLITVVLVTARNIFLKRAKLRFAIEQERRETMQLQELNQLKSKFFTNISHEFKTPLSLIITPIEKLLNQSADHTKEKKQFQLIYRNARRLLNLVDEMLDFKKLEEQELQLNPEGGDIIKFIQGLTSSFSEIADTRKISLVFHSLKDSFYTLFDSNKIERIVFNLLSNAFKFTPEGGSIQVVIDLLPGNEENGLQLMQLQVKDTGIGIDRVQQNRIFERFYQASLPETIVNHGSGIGLSITKEFVKLQNGTISVESEPGEGACFIVSIPFAELEILDAAAIRATEDTVEVVKSGLETEVKSSEKISDNKKTILVVEDSDDFRSYIKDSLIAMYHVVEASNGKFGWQKALSAHPDLVICDVTMPEMNGMDLCKKIKSDKRTSFIPVILLTALAGEENQLLGLETGANDFMTKPFNLEVLISKIKNLLQQQESFKKTYQKQVQVNPTEVVSESADDRFVLNALAVIEKNISNTDFSVEEMSRELHLSRVALYKKIFALTGNTPLEFIRSIRLKRAKQLLEKNELTIAEVAYEVGFNNPKIFSKYFKIEFNILPSTFLGEKGRKPETTKKDY